MPQPSVRRADLFSRVGILLSTSFAAGCDVVTVQRALGHASATVTLNTYANSQELHQTGEKLQVA